MSGSHLARSFAHLDSPVHRMPAWIKCATVLALTTSLAVCPPDGSAWAWVLCAPLLLVARLARLPGRLLIARLALAQPLVLSVALLALFQGRGLEVFSGVAAKTIVCVASVQLLALTTHFEDVRRLLLRAGFPVVILSVLALLHRYMTVLADEVHRMRRARAARSWSGRRIAAWRALSSVVAMSFVRSVGRAERVAAAMRARGAP